MLRRRALSFLVLLFGMAALAQVSTPKIKWVLMSSKSGQLPIPGASTQQTALLPVRVDPKGDTDFIIAGRDAAPALVWMRHGAKGWGRYVIDEQLLRIEAGGVAHDIDGDGDLDLVFGADGRGNELWWWENPYPDFRPDVPWKRHTIKASGENQHHDQIFADLKATGHPQLIFWNQRAKTLFLADVPKDPRNSGPWPLEVVFSGKAGEGEASAAAYAEGIDAFDVDGDGKIDLLAGNSWFKYLGNGKYQVTRIAETGGRIRAGRFKPGKYPQVVIAPGDGTGPLRFYECQGDPSKTESWVARNLLDRDMIHGHTLDLGDINGDGNLDIFAAEMAKWGLGAREAVNPKATAWILCGDGKGNFTTSVLTTGDGWHEGKLGDFDGDGDLDVLNKPFIWFTPRVDLWLNNGTGPRPKLQVAGMELWSSRRQLSQNLARTLGTIHGLGFRDIETATFYNRSAAEFRRVLDVNGLSCSSIIVKYARLREDLPSVIDDAKIIGARYVLTSEIPHKDALTAENVHSAAADFNRWGSALKAAGLQVGYHPHGFEFVPQGQSNLFDLLLAETKPGLVTYEMDVFWFLHGGADPIKYLNQRPGRFLLVHLKDMAKGTTMGPSAARASNEASVALGKGTIDWPSLFAAARKAGVKKYYIEDESPNAPLQVRLTVRYLNAHPITAP